MAFQESPSQRERREQKETLFGVPPMYGPELPVPDSPPGLKASAGQQKRDDAKKAFFATKSLRPTSLPDLGRMLGVVDPLPVKLSPVTGGKNKNEAPGETGSLEFTDCDGQQTGFVEWENGKMLTSGAQVIQAGCPTVSSYP